MYRVQDSHKYLGESWNICPPTCPLTAFQGCGGQCQLRRVSHNFCAINISKYYSHRTIIYRFDVINGVQEIWSNFGWYLDQRAISEFNRNTASSARLIFRVFSSCAGVIVLKINYSTVCFHDRLYLFKFSTRHTIRFTFQIKHRQSWELRCSRFIFNKSLGLARFKPIDIPRL